MQFPIWIKYLGIYISSNMSIFGWHNWDSLGLQTLLEIDYFAVRTQSGIRVYDWTAA